MEPEPSPPLTSQQAPPSSPLTQAALVGAAGVLVGRKLGVSGPGSVFLGLLSAAAALVAKKPGEQRKEEQQSTALDDAPERCNVVSELLTAPIGEIEDLPESVTDREVSATAETSIDALWTTQSSSPALKVPVAHSPQDEFLDFKTPPAASKTSDEINWEERRGDAVDNPFDEQTPSAAMGETASAGDGREEDEISAPFETVALSAPANALETSIAIPNESPTLDASASPQEGMAAAVSSATTSVAVPPVKLHSRDSFLQDPAFAPALPKPASGSVRPAPPAGEFVMWPEAPPDSPLSALTAEAVAALDPLPQDVASEATPFDLPQKPTPPLFPRSGATIPPFQQASRSGASTASGLSKSVFDDIGRELQTFAVPPVETRAGPAPTSAPSTGTLTPDQIWEMAAQLGSPPSSVPITSLFAPAAKLDSPGRTEAPSTALPGDFLLTPPPPSAQPPGSSKLARAAPPESGMAIPGASASAAGSHVASLAPSHKQQTEVLSRAPDVIEPPPLPSLSAGEAPRPAPAAFSLGSQPALETQKTSEEATSSVAIPSSGSKPISAAMLAEVASARSTEPPFQETRQKPEPSAAAAAPFARVAGRAPAKGAALAPAEAATTTTSPHKPPVGATSTVIPPKSAAPARLAPSVPPRQPATLRSSVSPPDVASAPVQSRRGAVGSAATAPAQKKIEGVEPPAQLARPVLLAVAEKKPPARRRALLWVGVILVVVIAGLSAAAYFFREDLRPLLSRQFWEGFFTTAKQGSPPQPAREADSGSGGRGTQNSSTQSEEAQPRAETATPEAAEAATSPNTAPSLPADPNSTLTYPPFETRPDSEASKAKPVETPPDEPQASSLTAGPERPAGQPTPASSLLPSGDFSLGETLSPAAEKSTKAASSDPTQADPELARAQTAVQALVSASTVDAIIPHIVEGERLRAGLANYYGSRPLEPLTNSVVEVQYSGKVPTSGSRAFIFSVVHPDHPRGFPVSAEATPNGYQIDWESYIQWRDEWLRGFLENRPAGPYTLFVVLQRSHYFNDDVPNASDKHCFKVASAVPRDPGTNVFADRRSPVGRSLAETYEWGKTYFPVVELEWTKEEQGAPYVRLNRMIRPTWRRSLSR